MSIRACLENAVAKYPQKVFLYFEDEKITYNDFNTRVNKSANYFQKTGIKKGDVVALFLPNCPEFLYNWFALAKIGAIMVPINTACKDAETEYILNHSEAKMVISTFDLLDIIGKIREKCGHLNEIISIDISPNEKIGVLADLIADSPSQLPDIEISKDDTACILYTSGTTGPPKGCMLPNEFYTLTGEQFISVCDIGQDDRLMTFMPLFHMAAQTTTTMGTILAGASFILIARFSASAILGQLKRYQPSLFSYIGAVLSFLDNLPESPGDKTHGIPRIFGGGATKELVERIEKRFNLKVIEGYGATEDGLPLSNCYKNGPRKIGSIGKPIGGREAKIVDDDERELLPGQQGEIAVRGKPLMSGYFKDPAATADVMRNGWFYTGDNGYMDDEGFFYFFGRKKDILRRAGENISSAEVEDVIRAHPKVFDVAVIGIPDNIRGEEVKACIILKTGETEKTVPPEEIVSFCSERLAYFKVPRYIEFCEVDFPRTPTNKVQKHILRKERAHVSENCYDRGETRGKV